MSRPKTTNEYKVYEHTTRNEMLPFVPTEACVILDVGCSVGNFGALLKSERKAEVWGVEIDREAADRAKGQLDRAFCGAFEANLGLPENAFDCIIFNDVLEHMVDPYSALEYAKTLLRPDGKIVASIPNVRYFGNMWMLVVHKSWKYEDAGILDRTHLRFFTETSIRSMFEEQGYSIERMEGINPLELYDAYFMKKFRMLNLLALNRFSDMRWLQFAVVASPAGD